MCLGLIFLCLRWFCGQHQKKIQWHTKLIKQAGVVGSQHFLLPNTWCASQWKHMWVRHWVTALMCGPMLDARKCILPFFWPLNLVVFLSPGCLWLRGEFPEERPQHPHCLYALHVHLCCHCCAALQRQILLLHWWVERAGEGLQVWQEQRLWRDPKVPLAVQELHHLGICWAWWGLL